jgi:hypothetical protein
MAYPASELLEKTYRNPIELVAEYLYATHQGHYLVLNCSGREYDPAPFGGRVKHYPWVDHQAPPLALLVQIAHDMVSHLSSTDHPTQKMTRTSWQCIATTGKAVRAQPSFLCCSCCNLTAQPVKH